MAKVLLGWNGLLMLGSLMFLGGIYNILAGPYNQIPVGVPILNPPKPFWSWISEAVPGIAISTLRMIFGLIVLLAILLIIIFIILVIVNPKEKGRRIPRRETIRGFFKPINRRGLLNLFWFWLSLYLIFFFLYCSYSLATFMISNQIKVLQISTTYQLGSTFERFFVAAGTAYLTISCSFLLYILRWKINKEDVFVAPSSGPINRFTGWAYIAALVISAVIPIYRFGVYPSIPQQIGGGLLIPVNINFGNKALAINSYSPKCSQFLLDRTGSSALVFCIDEQTKKYQVIEIPGGQIESIEYLGAPMTPTTTPTMTATVTPTLTITPAPTSTQ